VPFYELRAWPVNSLVRQHQERFAMIAIVLSAILKLLLDLLAYLQLELVGESDIAGVKQLVKISPHQKTVGEMMWTRLGIGLYVCPF
jgi:hypothetical protein